MTIGLAIWVALGVFGLQMASIAESTFELAWIGTTTPDSDSAYRRYQQALQRLTSASRVTPLLRYVRVRDEASHAVLQDLRRAGVRPAIWLAPTANAAVAVRLLAPDTPLVFATYPDPARLGLVRSLQWPGVPATGVLLGDQLDAKRLELLRDAFPRLDTIGVLLDTSWTQTRDLQATLIGPAAALGVRLHLLVADEPEQLGAAWAAGQAAGVQAWYIPPTYIAYRAEAAIINHLQRARQPAIHATVAEVATGALMAYAQDTEEVFDQLADLTLRVAGGEDAGGIPVQRPRRFLLAVRPRAEPGTPRIDPSLVRRADRVF